MTKVIASASYRQRQVGPCESTYVLDIGVVLPEPRSGAFLCLSEETEYSQFE